jgi:hypothetical protein
MDTLDVLLEFVITASTGRTPAGGGKTGGMFMPGGRFTADRLDSQVPMSMNAIIICRGGRVPPSSTLVQWNEG